MRLCNNVGERFQQAFVMLHNQFLLLSRKIMFYEKSIFNDVEIKFMTMPVCSLTLAHLQSLI